MTAAFQFNLTALSLLALLVGIFLIYNAMTFSVVQRRSLFGTLRSIGYTREQVFGMVLSEAALVGVLGTGLGLGLGVLLGQGAVQMVLKRSMISFCRQVRGIRFRFQPAQGDWQVSCSVFAARRPHGKQLCPATPALSRRVERKLNNCKLGAGLGTFSVSSALSFSPSPHATWSSVSVAHSL